MWGSSGSFNPSWVGVGSHSEVIKSQSNVSLFCGKALSGYFQLKRYAKELINVPKGLP